MTTVTLPDSLVHEVEEVTSLNLPDFVESTVRQELARRRVREHEQQPAQARTAITPVGGAGVLPDIDLTRWTEYLVSPDGRIEIVRELTVEPQFQG
jgi:hypothetical protein